MQVTRRQERGPGQRGGGGGRARGCGPGRRCRGTLAGTGQQAGSGAVSGTCSSSVTGKGAGSARGCQAGALESARGPCTLGKHPDAVREGPGGAPARAQRPPRQPPPRAAFSLSPEGVGAARGDDVRAGRWAGGGARARARSCKRSPADVRALQRAFIGGPLCALDQLPGGRARSKVGLRGAAGRAWQGTECLARAGRAGGGRSSFSSHDHSAHLSVPFQRKPSNFFLVLYAVNCQIQLTLM